MGLKGNKKKKLKIKVHAKYTLVTELHQKGNKTDADYITTEEGGSY